MSIALEKDVSFRNAAYMIALQKLDEYHSEANIIWFNYDILIYISWYICILSKIIKYLYIVKYNKIFIYYQI